MATSHPDHALISSNDVEGRAVYDESRRKIGEIDHLMIDKLVRPRRLRHSQLWRVHEPQASVLPFAVGCAQL